MQEDLLLELENKFKVTDFIGPDEKFKNFSDYVKGTHKKFEKKINDLSEELMDGLFGGDRQTSSSFRKVTIHYDPAEVRDWISAAITNSEE